MKEKFWYFGYVVALLLILLIAFTDFPSGADMALAILFTCVFSVTHTQLLHRRMLHTDSSYRINVLDERNIAIKEKAGNITNMITLMLLGIAMLIFITLNYMVSAIIVGVIILIQPLVLIIIYYFKLYGFCHNCRSNYPDTAIGPNHCKQYY